MNGLLRDARVGEQQICDGFALAQFLQNKMHRNARAFHDGLADLNFCTTNIGVFSGDALEDLLVGF